jgi:hypothetical protein
MKKYNVFQDQHLVEQVDEKRYDLYDADAAHRISSAKGASSESCSCFK